MRRSVGPALVAVLGVVCIAVAFALGSRSSDERIDAQPFAAPTESTAGTSTSAATAASVNPTSGVPTTTVSVTTTDQAATTDTSTTASVPVPTTAPAPLIVPPANMVLPSGATASIVPVGVLPTGELQIPDDPLVVGWWSGGAALGDTSGNIVLAGHVDSRRYGLGVFRQLLQVQPGQVVVLVDTMGGRHEFQVSARQQMAKGDLPAALFDRAAPTGLVLITCGGRFNASTRHYSDNVIVLATPVGADG